MKKVRDAEFSSRLEIACLNNDHCPTDAYRGKQKWLREEIIKKFPETKVSAEAVRKWFAGEARPRPKMMRAVATALEADEAWLSLGIAPEMSQKEKKSRARKTEGGAMLLGGIIQILGGGSTFPSPGEIEEADLTAIIEGKAIKIDTPLARSLSAETMLFILKRGYPGRKVVGVVPSSFGARFFIINSSIIEDHAVRRGDFLELETVFEREHLTVGNVAMTEITSLEMLTRELN